jgi:uncharacterized protein
MSDTPQVADRAERHRYELSTGGHVAGHIDYRLRGADVIDLVHTEVDPAYEGRGIASQLARFALDDARSHRRRVIASCEYIAAWVRKHPEYEDLLAAA